MIAGHLQIKNDNYYMVLNYTDANGKRRQPWIPTGLPAKGNKRRAEKLLLDTRKSFVPPVVSKENEDISSDMLFADYMELWLEIIRNSVEKTTFSSYTQMVKGKIAPYFRNTGLTLDGIQAKHIQSFYLHELKTVSPGTVIHYHANIHKALKYAVKMDLMGEPSLAFAGVQKYRMRSLPSLSFCFSRPSTAPTPSSESGSPRVAAQTIVQCQEDGSRYCPVGYPR